jgi:hypothetical protein
LELKRRRKNKKEKIHNAIGKKKAGSIQTSLTSVTNNTKYMNFDTNTNVQNHFDKTKILD